MKGKKFVCLPLNHDHPMTHWYCASVILALHGTLSSAFQMLVLE